MFLVNVPIGIAALVVVTRTLHLHTTVRPDNIRVDWWGATALFVGFVPLLTVAEQGRDWGWTSLESLVAYVVGAIGLVAFVTIENAMGDAALIPLRLFRIRAAAVAIGASVLIGVAMFGGIMLIPLYMQIAKGASPTESGILMLPMVLGMMISSILGGRFISRTGIIRPFPIAGAALVATGLLLLSFTSADTAMVWVSLSMFVLGIGLGNCMQPLLLIMQSAVPPSEIGVATSSATFFRQIGGTLGVAIFLSVLFGGVGQNIATATAEESQTPAYQQAVAAGDGVDATRDRPGPGRLLDHRHAQPGHRAPVQGRLRRVDEHGLPDRRRRRRARVPRAAPHARGRAALYVGARGGQGCCGVALAAPSDRR